MSNYKIDFGTISALCYTAQFSFNDYIHDVFVTGDANQISDLKVLLVNYRNATKKIYKELKNYEEKKKTK